MTQEEFEKLVKEGLKQIPKKYLKMLDNVAFVIEGVPSLYLLQQLKLHSGVLLFGLYQGIPKTRRGTGYTLVPPDKITIFQKAIEQYARTPENIKKLVKNTIMHEIGHHFGLSEVGVRAIEIRKKD